MPTKDIIAINNDAFYTWRAEHFTPALQQVEQALRAAAPQVAEAAIAPLRHNATERFPTDHWNINERDSARAANRRLAVEYGGSADPVVVLTAYRGTVHGSGEMAGTFSGVQREMMLLRQVGKRLGLDIALGWD